MDRYSFNETMKIVGKQSMGNISSESKKQIAEIVSAFHEYGDIYLLAIDAFQLGFLHGSEDTMKNHATF